MEHPVQIPKRGVYGHEADPVRAAADRKGREDGRIFAVVGAEQPERGLCQRSGESSSELGGPGGLAAARRSRGGDFPGVHRPRQAIKPPQMAGPLH